MSTLRELFAELRELGPSTIMVVLGGMIVIGVLTLLGQVYPDSKGVNFFVNAVAGAAMILGTGAFGFGFWFVLRSVQGNLWDIGIRGRRFLDGEEVLKRIREAKEIVIIKTWFPETSQIAGALKTALEGGASVKLILCKPDSEILKIRCEGAGVELTDASNWIRKGLDIVKKNAKYTDPFKGVRLHNRWPGCPVITADDRIYMGFYFRGNSSPNFPWLEIKKGSELGRYLKTQENELWNLGDRP